MSNQPEPLRLAREDEQMSAVLRMQPKFAPELRRLHAANVELLEALKKCALVCAGEALSKKSLIFALELAEEALSKHGGQQCAASPTST